MVQKASAERDETRRPIGEKKVRDGGGKEEEENRGRRKQPERETEERSDEESAESDAKTLEEAV